MAVYGLHRHCPSQFILFPSVARLLLFGVILIAFASFCRLFISPPHARAPHFQEVYRSERREKILGRRIAQNECVQCGVLESSATAFAAHSLALVASPAARLSPDLSRDTFASVRFGRSKIGRERNVFDFRSFSMTTFTKQKTIFIAAINIYPGGSGGAEKAAFGSRRSARLRR